jgi:Spy/CpxP family protein refolding chaperone
MEQMLASLNLTADQAQKVQDAMAAQRPAMEALRNDTTLSREQRREKMQALRQTLDAQLSTVLTPEQKAKWDAERAQRRERNGRGGNNTPGGAASTNSTP